MTRESSRDRRRLDKNEEMVPSLSDFLPFNGVENLSAELVLERFDALKQKGKGIFSLGDMGSFQRHGTQRADGRSRVS
jgi:hypothetical protein